MELLSNWRKCWYPISLCLDTKHLTTYKQKSIDDATPIALVSRLITKLHNHKKIYSIIEGNEELNNIVEQLSVGDCGCKDDSRFDEDFTILDY